MEDNDDKQEYSKILEAIEEYQNIDEVELLLKTKQKQFSIEGTNYRVRDLTPIEKLDVDTMRRRKYLEFMKDDSYLPKSVLIKQYKKKGFDITLLERDINILQTEIQTIQLQMATCQIENDIQEYKEAIIARKIKQAEINGQITDALRYSIEDSLNIFVVEYSGYLVLEKENEEGKWERAFNSYSDFLESNEEELKTKALTYLSFLIFGNRNL